MCGSAPNSRTQSPWLRISVRRWPGCCSSRRKLRTSCMRTPNGVEESIIDAEAAQHFGLAGLVKDAWTISICGHVFEGPAVVQQVPSGSVVQIGIVPSAGGGFDNGDQALRLRVRQRVQQDGFYHAKDGRIRAHAQGQCEYGDGRESGVPPQRA